MCSEPGKTGLCFLGAFAVCPTGCARCRTPVGDSHPPPMGNIKEKSRYNSTGSHLKYGGEGGIDSLRSPCGQPVHCVRGLSNGLCPLSNPGRGFSSPQHVPYAKKKPVLAYELFFKYGGEGGIDSLRSPCGRHGLRPFRPTDCARCRTPVRDSHPPQWEI